MKETMIKELTEVDLSNPVLIEGLPGLGLVGKIATRYLIKQLNAKKLAHLYSPHFPYFVLVNKKGKVRLIRGTFYFWKNPEDERDLIFFTGDSQAQTIEGQYEISDQILTFAEQINSRLVITLGGYRTEVENKPKVIASATRQEILDKALNAEAVLNSTRNPIVGTAGLILGLSRFKENVDSLCLLGETRGYLPDPKSAKSVLKILKKMLNLDVDLDDLDKEIVKADQMVSQLRKIEKKRALQAEELRKEEDKKITYIS